jgi:hypothetical protein
MTVQEVIKIAKDFEQEYDYVGIRYAEQVYQVGDILGNSKKYNNLDDEREFPKYGTPEYNELEEMDGASSWNLDFHYLEKDLEWVINEDGAKYTHCYIIGSNDIGCNDVLDTGELCIRNAKVLFVIA